MTDNIPRSGFHGLFRVKMTDPFILTKVLSLEMIMFPKDENFQRMKDHSLGFSQQPIGLYLGWESSFTYDSKQDKP